MGAETAIQWCHHTFNPWWGCVRVSPGCEKCYAEAFAHRLGLPIWGAQAPRRFFGEAHWREPLKWNRAAEKAGEKRRVFCASMADVGEDRADLHKWRWKLGDLILATPWLDWLLLTKRIENMARLFPREVLELCWLGTTAEDQKRWDERVPWLRKTPAAKRFVSYEPALGPINFGWLRENQVDWIIVGGESGHGARPFDLAWARSTIEQCKAAGVAVFCKQLGSAPADAIDGDAYFGPVLVDKKGGDMSEWPVDLRVREFPT